MGPTWGTASVIFQSRGTHFTGHITYPQESLANFSADGCLVFHPSGPLAQAIPQAPNVLCSSPVISRWMKSSQILVHRVLLQPGAWWLGVSEVPLERNQFSSPFGKHLIWCFWPWTLLYKTRHWVLDAHLRCRGLPLCLVLYRPGTPLNSEQWGREESDIGVGGFLPRSQIKTSYFNLNTNPFPLPCITFPVTSACKDNAIVCIS